MARARRFVPKKQKDLIWFPVISVNELVAASASSTNNIVQAADWIGSAGFERATLLAVRGWISIHRNNAVQGAWFAYIGKFNVGETIPAANAIATYGDEDIMWSGGGGFLATSVDMGSQVVINVKSKRKIDKNTVISCEIEASIADLRINLVLRGLVDRG